MPLYEYQCSDCGKRVELIQRFGDPPPAACESCGGGPMKKLLSAPAFQFKGSGWYVTDYARKGGGEGKAAEPEAKKAAAEGGGGETTAKGDKGRKTEKADKPAAKSAPKPASSSD